MRWNDQMMIVHPSAMERGTATVATFARRGPVLDEGYELVKRDDAETR
jgi:hypothetical protein